MQTASGRAFYPLEPERGGVYLLDVVHALSQVVRYGGHCPEPYTVGHHSVLVGRRAMQLADGQGMDLVRVRAAGLLGLAHDCAESYLADLIRPIKKCMPEYLAAEQRVERVILQQLSLPIQRPRPGFAAASLPALGCTGIDVYDDQLWELVHKADNEVLATEAAVFFPEGKRPMPWGGLAEGPVLSMLEDVSPAWAPARTRVEFLRMFCALGGQLPEGVKAPAEWKPSDQPTMVVGARDYCELQDVSAAARQVMRQHGRAKSLPGMVLVRAEDLERLGKLVGIPLQEEEVTP